VLCTTPLPSGYLIGDKIEATISSLLNTLTDSTAVLNQIIEEVLLWQWAIALSLQTPSSYIDEMRGISDGAAAAGYNPKSESSLGSAVSLSSTFFKEGSIILASQP